ncbi:MAG: NAD(P)-dependent oxidoreductase [Saprospiraceae bacterium]|nr:NAD(P)-dependent oxidoreductase [Saprospiraceae bacterium]
MKRILITGAAGNLGGLLADYLKDSGFKLNLLYHKKEINPKLKEYPNINIFKADLANKETLSSALKDVDTIVHFAGILFMHNPEKFLPITNTIYFKNLVDKAIESNVKRIILISFPHVEGETTPESPAKGILDGNPISMHAKTRLEEEKSLFSLKNPEIEKVSLRVGMVYSKGILMIDAARWFAKHRILGIWKKPTWIHLISKRDFCESTKQAIIKDGINGIYHIGDDGKQTLQEFLDAATNYWGYKPPLRMPVGVLMFVARSFELFSFLFGVKSPLTRDFVTIGMVSYYGDTKRMRTELLKDLKYRTFKEGIDTL